MRISLMLAVLALLLPAAAMSQTQGDPERGRVIGYTCSGCHGIPFYQNIYPNYSVPRIAGQNQEYLISALNAYRNGEREHATMQAQASSLSDQDIIDVTAWLVEIAREQTE